MNVFDFIKGIITNHPAFRGKENQLKELHSISNSDQQILIFGLLNRFYSITRDEKRDFRINIAKLVLDNTDVLLNPILFSDLVVDGRHDSGGSIVYDLKIEFEKQTRTKALKDEKFKPDINFIGHFNKLEKRINKKPDTNYNIILADEFVGSGKTLKIRLSRLQRFQNINVVHVFFFAGMEYAIKSLKRDFPNVFFHVNRVLEKGITEFFKTKKEIDSNIKLMIDLESNLGDSINGALASTYSLGYNKAEALYNNELIEGNTVNNVFPIFWWPEDKANKVRNSLFIRSDNRI